MTEPNVANEALPLILPACWLTENQDDGLHFYGGHNLFKRIIRNPASYGRLPKERECAEMLCGCLMHMPVFRSAFLEKLSKLAEQPVDLDRLDFSFSTEQPMMKKRDDLRIEGFDNENGIQQIIWSIEIKVGSWFHESSPVFPDGDPGENDKNGEMRKAEPESVNQLVNYDNWLMSQVHVPYRAGFVISIWNQEQYLPGCLKETWQCLRWYDLAVILDHILQKNEISEVENFLGCNLSGFIHESLGGREMENRLGLEDIALIAAFYQQGPSTHQRMKNLISSVAYRFKSSGPLPSEPKYDYSLLKPDAICTFWWDLGGSNSGYPCLCSGITSNRGNSVIVYFSTEPKHPSKSSIRAFIETKIDDLQSKNPEWQLVSNELSKYWDLDLRVPLEILLGQDDQVEWMYRHFQKAFKELEEVGIIKGIQNIVLEKTTEQGSTHA